MSTGQKVFQRTGRGVLALLLGFLLAGCGTAAPLPPMPTLDEVLPTPVITPTEYRGLCANVWSEEQLPEVSTRLNQFLRKAALERADASVSAYGETCVDSGTNVVVRFTPKEVNYSLTVQVDNISDTRALGDWLKQIVLALEDFQAIEASMVGSKAGRVEVVFQDASRATEISFPLVHGQELVNQGVKGASLFEQLSQ